MTESCLLVSQFPILVFKALNILFQKIIPSPRYHSALHRLSEPGLPSPQVASCLRSPLPPSYLHPADLTLSSFLPFLFSSGNNHALLALTL